MSEHPAVCLRCGFCCLFYRVVFPNYGFVKPGAVTCPFLIPRQRENGRWKLASCSLYGLPGRPKACHRYCGECTIPKRKKCPGGVCPEGLRTWRETREEYPEDIFPPEIEKYL